MSRKTLKILSLDRSFAHLIFQELWLSDFLKEALWNVEKLMSFVGVDQAPVEPSDADTCGINRYIYIESCKDNGLFTQSLNGTLPGSGQN